MAKYTDRTYPDALWMCIPAYYYSDIDHNNPVYVLIPWDYRTRALLKDAFYKLDTVIEKGGISEVSSLRVLDKISIYSMGALPFWDEETRRALQYAEEDEELAYQEHCKHCMRGDASGQDNVASRLSDADIDVLCYYDTCANDVIRTMDLDDFFCGDIVFLSGLTTRPDDLPSVVMREIIITKTGAVFTAEDTAAVDLDTCGATYADALLFTDLQLPRDMLGGVDLVPLDLSEGGVTYDGFLNANWVHIPDVMREYRIRKAGNDKAKKGGMIK